ncbi:UvrD-helicase domain-containing protein [Micromonospora chersina]|uniref:UvrD-helicase domain-containing protein n=1 Tax=Micromonospora chersina TaxID=47854 RepID=UPI0033D73BD4
MAGLSDEDLSYEIAANRSYLRALERRLARKNPEVSVTANERYVNNVPRGERASIGPLYGRVGLAAPDDDLGIAFYVGTRYLSSGDWDHPVISWAARAAKVFFDPHETHELNAHVLVRRTLTVRGSEVVHAADDWTTSLPADQSPFKAGRLHVPAPPRRPASRTPAPALSSARTPASTTHPTVRPSSKRRATPPNAVPAPRPAEGKPLPKQAATSRAPVRVGRHETWPSLPTKPADLETWQLDAPLIVARSHDSGADLEGVAAVRAVNLVRHLARDKRRVLIVAASVGPLRRIRSRIHTAAASAGLSAVDISNVITIIEQRAWLAEVAGYRRFTSLSEPDALDVGAFVAGIAEQAVELCCRRLDWLQREVRLSEQLKIAYEVVRNGGLPHQPLRLGRYSSQWIGTLPPFDVAWGRARYVALFAQLASSIKGPDGTRPYGHVVVHDGHQFSGLSCAVLRTNNPTAQWTIFGDLIRPKSSDINDRLVVTLAERLGIASRPGEADVIIVRPGKLSRHSVALPQPQATPALTSEDHEQVPVRSPEPTGRRQRSTEAIGNLERGMRAVDSVRFALHAPRTEALTSVLSTLQPDQYRLVTQPPTMPLVIQGHPGTGKTIIAVHRAGYLVNEEATKRSAIPRVLLLGPTEQYVRHVSRVVAELDPTGHITVKSLPAWLAELAGLRNDPKPGEGTPEDVGGFVGGLAKHAVLRCQGRPEWKASGRAARVEMAYEAIRGGGGSHQQPSTDEVGRRWIETLPPFVKARGQRRYLPLLAQLGMLVDQEQSRYEHIVVDEAQDVSELEWEIIRAHNLDGRWTIVGDVNQRRRLDIGHLDWRALAKRLDIFAGGELFQPEVVERGYRSTQPILDFANRLLPYSENRPCSLQTEGPEPAVIRASTPGRRDVRAVGEAHRLLDSYEGGRVAIITTDPDAIAKLLITSGWRRTDLVASAGDWIRDGHRLVVHTPESARGVEFDGVVVVEPSYFVRQEEFVGTLYTSLTRANRELVVVHSKPLPDPLRKR